MSDWAELDAEIALWRKAGRTPALWWRDDDAAEATPALDRLLSLAQIHAVPIGIAAVPATLTTEAVARIAACPHAALLQHGFRHDNHGGAEAKSEFPASRPLGVRRADVEAGFTRIKAIAGAQFLPVFVPPWNRMAEELAPVLVSAGLKGLSRNKPRTSAIAAPGLRQANIQVDLVDWHQDRRFLGEARVLAALVEHLAAKRLGQADADEPTGILSHHLVQDEDTWDFLGETCARYGSLFQRPAVVFDMP